MNHESVNRLRNLHVCQRCSILFLNPGNIDVLVGSQTSVYSAFETLIRNYQPTMSSDNEKSINCKSELFCPCCYGVLEKDSLHLLAERINQDLKEKFSDHLKRNVFISVIVPPVLDLARLTLRLVVTGQKEKSFPFPTMSDLLQRLLSILLSVSLNGSDSMIIVDDVSLAEVQVNVSINFDNQEDFCRSVYDGYKHKNKKRRCGEVFLSTGTEFEVSRADSDSVLLSFKSLDQKGIENLENSLRSYLTSTATVGVSEVQIFPRPIYLLGRYRKLARDVPQACWTIGEDRMGRSSVEEIVAHTVLEQLSAKTCKMHPCGREDIDVRCLGNGRPFIMEVSEPYKNPSLPVLQNIVDIIKSRDGLNAEGDIEVLSLSLSDRSVWETMQTVAEEKRKAYCCVCWSAKAINVEDLNRIERLCIDSSDTDEENRPCLKIVQKTPLRVLHRRSLLDRVRYIYNINTVLLNDHYFLLKLCTSAGTYVKEFCHGDLGRTSPSISSILGCQADILQLDVVWLYDDFIGGGEPPSTLFNKSIEQICDGKDNESKILTDIGTTGASKNSLEWQDLKNLKLALKSKRSKSCV